MTTWLEMARKKKLLSMPPKKSANKDALFDHDVEEVDAKRSEEKQKQEEEKVVQEESKI